MDKFRNEFRLFSMLVLLTPISCTNLPELPYSEESVWWQCHGGVAPKGWGPSNPADPPGSNVLPFPNARALDVCTDPELTDEQVEGVVEWCEFFCDEFFQTVGFSFLFEIPDVPGQDPDQKLHPTDCSAPRGLCSAGDLGGISCVITGASVLPPGELCYQSEADEAPGAAEAAEPTVQAALGTDYATELDSSESYIDIDLDGIDNTIRLVPNDGGFSYARGCFEDGSCRVSVRQLRAETGQSIHIDFPWWSFEDDTDITDIQLYTKRAFVGEFEADGETVHVPPNEMQLTIAFRDNGVPKIIQLSNDAAASASLDPDSDDFSIDLDVSDGDNSATLHLAGTYVNRPPEPEITVPPVVECAGHDTTSVTLDGSGSTDPDNRGMRYHFWWTNADAADGEDVQYEGEGVTKTLELSYGHHVVGLRAEDNSGAAAYVESSIEIKDTTAPTVTCMGDTQECTGTTTPVTTSCEAEDVCDNSVTPQDTALTSYPVGNHQFTCWATDDVGNLGSDVCHVVIEDTIDPVATCVGDAKECTGPSTPVNTSCSAMDSCDSAPNAQSTANASYPVGDFQFSCTATDATGHKDVATCAIEIRDTVAPSFSFVPPAITISACVTPDIGTAVAEDLCDLGVQVTNDAPDKFPLGTTIVKWTARDASNNTTTATQEVTAVLADDPSCCPDGTNIIIGSDTASDVIFGTPGSDCILGRGGNDVINSAHGDDYVSGGRGIDTLTTGLGNDYLNGGPDHDICFAPPGNDTILNCP